MKQLTLIFSLSVLSVVATGQNKELDSLYQALHDHPQEDTNRVLTLTRICYYEYTSAPEKCKKHAEEARRIAGKIKYTKGIGLSLRYTSLYYWVTGNYDKAADFAFQMLKVFEDANDEHGLARAYTLIGLIHEEWGNFDKSKDYHLKSLALNEKANRFYDMAYNYNSLGALHDRNNKSDEAYAYYLKSLELRKKIQDEDGMSQSYVNLGSIAHDRKDYDNELEYYTLALPIAKKLGNINRLSLISQALGKIYTAKGEFENADRLLHDALAMARRLGNQKIQRAIYRSLLTMEEHRGDYKKALRYSVQVMAMQDSIFSEEKTRQMAAMEASYEAEKKEQAIALLSRDNKIRALWQNILGGSLAIMVLGGFVYYRMRRSNDLKNKKLLAAQASVNKKLVEIDRMKSDFFASVSHELRTPLTLIKGPIEQFLEQPEKSMTTEKAEMIHRNCNRLLRLVNQLLDLSKLETGNLRLENKDGDIFKLLRVISSSFESYAEQHNITYTVTFTDHSLQASFDHDKLEKIVYNLLSNAFKFTSDHGTISFKCSHAEQKLIIKISDTGRGIEPRHLPHIFDRFYQVSDHQPYYEGTGIGLSLVKELVTLMEGEISVESMPGNGTTFSVILPLILLKSSVQEDSVLTVPEGLFYKNDSYGSRTESLADETILIIEDNTDMRGFIREQLAPDYQIIEAGNGRDGLALACREVPDLIISDIMMPEMNGITLVEAIKQDERTSHIPVIMLTAREGRESKMEGLETGADDYLTKPFDSHELKIRIKNLIIQRAQLRLKYSQQVVLQPKNIAISSVDHLFLQKVEEAIEKHLPLQEFGVPQMQDVLSMSKTQLHRKMKALTGQAPGEFLRTYRLKRAADLLEQQGGSVTEIAFAVGFGSLSYFTRSFKDLFGKAPSEYSQFQKERI